MTSTFRATAAILGANILSVTLAGSPARAQVQVDFGTKSTIFNANVDDFLGVITRFTNSLFPNSDSWGANSIKRHGRTMALIAVALLGWPAGSLAAPQQTFLNPTPAADDQFGRSVGVSGDNVVVGANFDDAGATDSGAAYLFDAATGTLLKTFLNPTPEINNDQFGVSVGVSDNNVVVGAPLDDAGATNSGAAYLFDAATGALLKTFLNPTPANFDEFGRSVGVTATNVVVGANLDDTNGNNSGAAYLFDAATGTLLKTFLNPTPADFDLFGFSVGVSGNNVVVGAPQDSAGAAGSGAAYLFDAATGALLQTFLNPTPAVGDGFGISVGVSGNNVVVGAFQDNDASSVVNSGAAYLFDAATGNLLRTFVNPTPTLGDKFGFSVGVSGNNVVVGASGDDAGATDSGAAYLFDAATGTLLRTFLNPTPADFDEFGFSVGVSGNNVVVGANLDDTNGNNSGAAYLFAIVLDQDGDGVLDADDNCPTVPNPGQEQTGNNVGGPFGDACVDPTVKLPPDLDIGVNPIIGANTKFGSGVTIGANFVAGANTKIEANATLGDDVTLGDNVKIQTGAVIGDRVQIGDNSKVEAGAMLGDDVVLGKNVKVQAGVVIGNGVNVPDGTTVTSNLP